MSECFKPELTQLSTECFKPELTQLSTECFKPELTQLSTKCRCSASRSLLACCAHRTDSQELQCVRVCQLACTQ
jgi:hypothetical protein